MNSMERADKQIEYLEKNYGRFRGKWTNEEDERKAFVAIYDKMLNSYKVMVGVDNEYVWEALETQVKKDERFLRQICKRYPIPSKAKVRKPYKHLTYSDRIMIEALSAEGCSVQEIAEHLGFNRQTIYNEIRRNGDSQQTYKAKEAQERILQRTQGIVLNKSSIKST